MTPPPLWPQSKCIVNGFRRLIAASYQIEIVCGVALLGHNCAFTLDAALQCVLPKTCLLTNISSLLWSALGLELE